MRLKMAFVGTALGLFGYMLLSVFSFYLFIIPGAWGLVAFYKYVARNTRLSDGSGMDFVGTPIEFLKLLLITVSLPLVLSVILGMAMATIQQNNQSPDQFMGFFMLIYLLIFVWSFYWGFKILKWAIGGIQFSWGGRLAFEGGILGYIGWILLMYIGMGFFIIPGFFVMSAMLKWMCEKTKSSTGDRLVWVGSGWELFWRSLVAYIACIFIVTIPWVMHWYIKWMTSMVEVERAGGAPAGYAPAPAPASFVPPPPPGPPPAPPTPGGRYGGIGGGPSSSGPAPTSSGSNDPGLWGPGT